MRRKILVALLCLAFSSIVITCGNKNNSIEATETNSIVEVTETIETEVVVTGSIEPTEVQEIETDPEETVEVNDTEDIAVSESPQSLELTYEDFECSYNGYTNYIDFETETPEKHEIQIVYAQPEDETYYLPAENDVTKRGLMLGDSKERVLELYGDYDKKVVYRNMRLKYDDLIPEENYIYYLDDPKPTTVDGLYMLCITLDREGNVLAILYGWAESKYM